MKTTDKCLENTENFLRSYLIQKDLSQVSGCEPRPATLPADLKTAPVKPFDTDLKCGQVRLLADVSRPTYIVLLRRQGDDAFVTMAFSHYDFPATNEELSLERYAGCYLNVLQVWNTRALYDETLRRSWLCGTLPGAVCDDAWDFRLSITTGSPMPEHLIDKTGTPIEQSDDIRLEYLREETLPFAGIRTADQESAESATDEEENNAANWFDMDRYFLPSPLPAETMALAAADEKKNINTRCAIHGREETLCLEYSPDENKVWIDVFDAGAGNRVLTLDHAAIVNVKGKELGTIQGGECMFDVEPSFDGSIGIRTEDGTVYILEELP